MAQIKLARLYKGLFGLMLLTMSILSYSAENNFRKIPFKNFPLQLSLCTAGIEASTGFGANRIVARDSQNSLCHVTFSAAYFDLDCRIPLRFLMNNPVGTPINTNAFCSQTPVPLSDDEKQLLALLGNQSTGSHGPQPE